MSCNTCGNKNNLNFTCPGCEQLGCDKCINGRILRCFSCNVMMCQYCLFTHGPVDFVNLPSSPDYNEDYLWNRSRKCLKCSEGEKYFYEKADLPEEMCRLIVKYLKRF
jgi:hypothetical protein